MLFDGGDYCIVGKEANKGYPSLGSRTIPSAESLLLALIAAGAHTSKVPLLLCSIIHSRRLPGRSRCVYRKQSTFYIAEIRGEGEAERFLNCFINSPHQARISRRRRARSGELFRIVFGSAPARKDDVNFKSSTIRFFGVDDDDPCGGCCWPPTRVAFRAAGTMNGLGFILIVLRCCRWRSTIDV